MFKRKTTLSALLVVITMTSGFAKQAEKSNIKQSHFIAKRNTPATVLSLNPSRYSHTLSQLNKRVDSIESLTRLPLTKQSVKKLIEPYSIIHLDSAAKHASSKTMSKIIDAALMQGKTLLLENTEYLQKEKITSLPFMANGEIVIVKPSKKNEQDRIFVYGAHTAVSGFTVSHSNSATQRESKLITLQDGISKEVYQSPSIHTLSMEDRISVLNDIAKRLEQREENSLNKTGGSIGYPCPTLARQERLCWAAIVTNVPYQHTDENADLNVLHHYSVAQYRTDQATAIAISTHGSANPTMKKDSSTHKAFYLHWLESEIRPTSTDSMQLWSRTPANQVNTVALTSTSGMTFGIDVTAQDKPSLGANISYSESQSVRMDISDWESNTLTPDGVSAKWVFQLNYPKSISDWVEHPTFKKARFKSVPNISKYGLQYTTEAIWVGSKNLRGSFEASMTTKVRNSQIYFTTNSIFKWAATRTGWIHTLQDGGYWFNNAWLKAI
ncbi:hypothetical protein [Pleionea sediminis]|uniref:hypothetical protein n=1 Tax=Pleionea sediminis TaxID=2569479 RepID=UPI001184D72C|nr:hypothetical protein [Pleionea sediminis]